MKKYLIPLTLFLFLINAITIHAQTTTDLEAPNTLIGDVTDVISILRYILRLIYTIFFIVAAIFIILAAFDYLTAGGSDEKIKKAKKELTYAIIAIIVALVAVSIKAIATSLLTGRG